MARRADLSGAIVLLALLVAFGACSQDREVASQRTTQSQAALSAETPGIVPSPAFGFHELRLSSDVSAASFGGLTGADRGQLVIWMVNGKAVHTGASLNPSYTAPGDRITAVVKAADAAGTWQELSRHETVVQDSAPRVQEIHLQRDRHDPYLLHAVLRAEDPDGEPIQLRYRWFRDGAPIEGQTGDRLQLDAQAVGARIEVEVVALDGSLESKLHRSPVMQVEGSGLSLEISNSVQLRELSDGRVEYLLSIQHTEGARVQLLDAPRSVRYENGALVWRPQEDEKELRMRVRAEARDGQTVERDVSLQL